MKTRGRPKGAKYEERFMIRVPSKLYGWLKDRADKQGDSLSQYCRKVLDEDMKQFKS